MRISDWSSDVCSSDLPSSRHRAQSCALRSCMRWNRTIGMTSTSSRRTATDEESGQSRLLKNSLHSVVPNIRVSDQPSRSGMTNSTTAGKKQREKAPMLTGRQRGTVIAQEALQESGEGKWE